MKKKLCSIIFMCIAVFYCCLLVYGTAINNNENVLTKYVGELFKTNGGYTDFKEIKYDDPHYGLNIGGFFVTGYTNDVNEDNVPVFLKNVGDNPSFNFTLDANIDDLIGNGEFLINEDKDGYDEYFQTKKTNIGKGALFIRHTSYENNKGEVQTYVNYLEGKRKGANVQVELLEEGDYEFKFDYEIKKNNHFGIIPTLASYTNYTIKGKFKIRNANCMVYPMDIKTKTELQDKSVTENGFYLDLAKSRYLNIHLKKKILIESEDKIVEDTRFNGTAKDGDKYKDEGIYIITVKNRYTNESTEKSICVGKNNILRANFLTGVTVKEYKEKLQNTETRSNNETQNINSNNKEKNETKNKKSLPIIPLFIVIAIIILVILKIKIKAKNANYEEMIKDNEETKDE